MLINEAVKTATSSIQEWLDSILKLWPNILVVLSIMIVCFILSRILKKILKKILRRLTVSEAVIQLITALISVLLFIFGLLVSLEVLKLERTVTSLLAGAGIAGLAIGFAFQDIVTNIIAGVIIAIRKPFDVGHTIETNNFTGKVIRIRLRIIEIDNGNGQIIIIPTRDVLQKPIINYSRTGLRKINLNIGIALNSNLDLVKKAAIEALTEINELDTEKQIEVYFKEFGTNSINITISFWINYTRNQNILNSQSKAIELIKNGFEFYKIEIPCQLIR